VFGRTVFSDAAPGNTAAFAGKSSQGEALANGIYLYAAAAYGLDDGVARSVEKLAWLR